jgi:hypothetical protein
MGQVGVRWPPDAAGEKKPARDGQRGLWFDETQLMVWRQCDINMNF